MKGKSFINQKLYHILIVLVLLGLVSCEKSVTEQDISASSSDELTLKKASVNSKTSVNYVVYESLPLDQACGEVFTTTFIAGKNYVAGGVKIFNNENKLFISITMAEGWSLYCTHIYVGEYANIPFNNAGNPQNGKFPFSDCFKKGAKVVTYEFSKSDFSATPAVLIHGEVKGPQEETAWAKGKDFEEANRWGWYIDYKMQTCIVIPPPR